MNLKTLPRPTDIGPSPSGLIKVVAYQSCLGAAATGHREASRMYRGESPFDREVRAVRKANAFWKESGLNRGENVR